MEKFRVRFAPSPTGALHIGGVRTALYNYLFARKYNGTFILRIEDTDRTRFVPGAEAYIKEALDWCGLTPDEGPGIGGAFGPYRQSERRDIYQEYATKLLENGHAYYAFDTPEELELKRKEESTKGNHTFKYDAKMRLEMKNSLTLSEADVLDILEAGESYTLRLKIPKDETIEINDLIRGKVLFQSNELDDKVILKGDGLPTYHLANIVDDYLMQVTHVIRGEEWLPSTAHHVLLYRYLGWSEHMPQFAHLPLIMKPTGQGKLGKRDGAKFGIPVFPLKWEGDKPEETFHGFREFGFDPRAVVNFLAFLGWNPGTEQELFSLEELTTSFSIKQIGKSGARFDYDKAKWFNQQYIMASDDALLAKVLRPLAEAKGYHVSDRFLASFCGLMKERVSTYNDFLEKGYYFFEEVKSYDQKTIKKKWKPEKREYFDDLYLRLSNLDSFSADAIKQCVESFMEENSLGFGQVFPILRVALSGTMKGPSVFEMMDLLGKEAVLKRFDKAYKTFDELAGLAG